MPAILAQQIRRMKITAAGEHQQRRPDGPGEIFFQADQGDAQSGGPPGTAPPGRRRGVSISALGMTQRLAVPQPADGVQPEIAAIRRACAASTEKGTQKSRPRSGN